MTIDTPVFATDRGYVSRLLTTLTSEGFPLHERVTLINREGIVQGITVTEAHATIDDNWNRNHKVLWEFLLALEGRGDVNLQDFLESWRGTPTGTRCMLALQRGLKVNA